MEKRNPETWRRLEAILDQALEIPREAQAAFLDEVCPPGCELREEVEALLAADAEAEGFLETPAVERAAPLLLGPESEEALGDSDWLGDQRIGPYRVVRMIGRGGMGVVFLAERVDGQFRQRVALKLIKRGMNSRNIVRRFLQERQILAQLQHPNLARLVDGGITADGLPYFAMEYVEGVPVTTYCDTRRLGIDERLRLFEDVCAAVRYAHRNLIVHRDLKPSNILVTREGQVKLLDFGIAKLLDQDNPEATTLTEVGRVVMTPEYAAPEQIRREPVTTATDVYSLGVLLYELLTGNRPLRQQRATLGEIERAILQEEPIRPSEAVSRVWVVRGPDGTTEEITPESVSAARATRPERLRAELSGDLDNMVLMALRKEPERRYSSVEALTDDLGRYRAGLPVAARKDVLSYRMRKFVLRHKVGVCAVVLVALSLLGGLAGTAWQAQVASREARKAAEVTDFLVNLFVVSDPDRSRGETITARDLLDQGAERIEEELADQPELRAEMMNLLGRLYAKLGMYDRAVLLLERALAARRALHTEEHPGLAENLHDLALALHHQGDYERAETIFREVLLLQRRLLGTENPEVATILDNLATLLQETGLYDSAETLLREALNLRRRLLGQEHPQVATALDNLASVLHKKGEYDSAETLFRQALTLRRRLLAEDDPDLAKTLNNLAVLVRDKGDLPTAESLIREALEIYRSRLGEEHPYGLVTQHNLAALLHDKGNYQEAEKLYRETLATSRRVYGAEHFHICAALHSLALLLHDKSDYAEAAVLYRQALVMALKLLGPDHLLVATIQHRLGMLLLETVDPGAAEPYLQKALGTYRSLYPQGHARTAEVLAGLSRVRAEQGGRDEAERLLQEALSIRLEESQQPNWRTAQVKVSIAVSLAALGRHADCEHLLKEALTTLEAERGYDDPLTRKARQALAALDSEHVRLTRPPPAVP